MSSLVVWLLLEASVRQDAVAERRAGRLNAREGRMDERRPFESSI